MYVWGEVEDGFEDKFVASIRNNVFEPLVAQEPEEEKSGWCSVADPFDLDLTYDKVFFNNYVNLSLRIDRWRLPKPVFDAHFAQAAKEYLEKKERERLTRKEKEDLRIFVAKRLRKQVIPQMRIIDMSWDMEAKVVRFWNNSPKTHERFMEIFEKTFKLKLVPESPYANAIKIGITEEQAKSLVNKELSMFHGTAEER